MQRYMDCSTCGIIKPIEGEWDRTVAYCKDCMRIHKDAFDEARAINEDWGDALRTADEVIRQHGASLKGSAGTYVVTVEWADGRILAAGGNGADQVRPLLAFLAACGPVAVFARPE